MPYLIILTLLLAPAYVIRFTGFHIPSNLLMLWVVLVWVIFALAIFKKNLYQDFTNFVGSIDKKILAFTGIFFLGGFISLFVKGLDVKKLGTFIVLFIQPISLFFIFGWIFKQSSKARDWLLTTCYILLAVAGLYAIIQYFTLLGLPPAWWGNSQEPKRALAFFAHPNFYALFAAPLLAFLIPDVMKEFSILNFQFSKLWKSALWIIGVMGLLLSLSRAGWLGLTAAIAIYFFVAADKKIRRVIAAAVIVIVIVIVATPNLRWRFLLPFRGETSASSRIILWHGGIEAIKQSPILGLGLDGFGNRYREFIPVDALTDTHNYPHNIFMDVWVETGLLGLIGFIGLISLYIFRGLRVAHSAPAKEEHPAQRGGLIKIKNEGLRFKDFYFPIALFLIALLVQGQIDNPYFKNDLAMVFWIVLAMVV